MDAVLHHTYLVAQAEMPPGFWAKVWDQGDAFFGAAVVVVGFVLFYLKVYRPDQKAESAARTERAQLELAEAVEKTKHQELASQMVNVQREIIDKASNLMTRFEGSLSRHEKAVDRHERIVDEKSETPVRFSPRERKG